VTRWIEGDFLGFDTETTGVETDIDRIVTAALVRVPAGATEPSAVSEWVADPGIEVPEEAAKIHGFTTERVRAEGRPAGEVLEDLVTALGREWTPQTPCVIANAPYDLSLLDAECRRHLGRPLHLSGYVLDPMVCDRRLDKYRKGSRKLDALCKHYGVTLDHAHTATADALAAVLVMRALIEVFPEIERRQIPEMHHFQKAWRQEWAASYQVHVRGQARQRRVPEVEIQQIVIDSSWPMKPREVVGGPGWISECCADQREAAG
jgi:DNA polymerase-3 subunit epsilon